jgi:cytochrome c oxidase cbb3-type subunit 2
MAETVRRRGPARFVAGLLASLAAVWVFGGSAETAPDPAAPPVPYEVERWRTTEPGEFPGYNQRASLIARGRQVYEKYCVGCHGPRGDGNGPAAVRLLTRPRDFTSGIFKFRSTDSGSLPLDSDLYRTISRGLSRVSMPAFPLMPEGEKVAVIEYIKTFYPRWEAEQNRRRIVPVPQAPDDLTDELRVRRGRVIYVEMQCSQCHGIDGQGTGATRTEYVDAWGHPQRPFNFTRGSLKGGDAPADVYRTFMTGLQSIMPSYGGETLATASVETFREKREQLDPTQTAGLDEVLAEFPASPREVFERLSPAERAALAERNAWDLVAYILSLRNRWTTAEAVLGPPAARATPEP